MKSLWKRLSISACVALIALAVFSTNAKADDWNKKTFITISQPMEIPGRMILPAGEYTIKLLDLASTRNVVQFFSRDEKHLYNTVFAIPDYHLDPAEESTLTFYEKEPGRVQAVRTWITRGSTTGLEFLYPKARADELAAIRPSLEPVQTAEVVVLDPVIDNEPIAEVRTEDQSSPYVDPDADVESTPAYVAPEPVVAEPEAVSEEAAAAPVMDQQDSTAPELPKTSGVQGLLLLAGMGSAAGALALRRFRR